MSFVSLYAYINPVIAVALGVLVLHEPFTGVLAVAACLVFGGVALVRLAQRPTATQGSSPKPAANGTSEAANLETADLKKEASPE